MAALKIPAPMTEVKPYSYCTSYFSVFWSEMEALKKLSLFKKPLKQTQHSYLGFGLELVLLHETKGQV